VPLGPQAEAGFADAIVATLRNPPSPPLALPQFSSEVIGAQHVNLYRGLLSAKVLPAMASCNRSGLSAPASALLKATGDPATLRGDERC
jgi:hypothetical protein